MVRDLPELIAALHEATDVLRRGRVAELSKALVERLRDEPAALDATAAAELLARLRRRQFFPQMRELADVLIQTGQRAPVVRRQYAQALIELGAFTAAVAVLRALEAEVALDPDERGEVLGLLGRALKQQYVSAGHPGSEGLRGALREAVDCYLSGYALAPGRNHWQGINAVACLARARRDGVDLDVAPSEERGIATAIRAALMASPANPAGPTEPFAVATALEAAVALGDWAAAKDLAQRYATNEAADAFALGSTVRQLTQVWELGESGDAPAVVLDTLRGALLSRHQGFVELSPRELVASAERYERNFVGAPFLTRDWYAAGLARARSVARIGWRYGQRSAGTGFLMRGAELTDRLGGRWVVLTNAHVVGDDEAEPGAIDPTDAWVDFEALGAAGGAPNGARAPYRVRRVLWSSPRTRLDTTVLELDEPVAGIDDADAYEVAARLPGNARSDRIYIIGHPAGGLLSFSLQDNLFLERLGHLLRYRTPTENGSSGSPLFDKSWKLIGIHHRGFDDVPRLDGSGVDEANEGISIHAIRDAIATDGLRPDA